MSKRQKKDYLLLFLLVSIFFIIGLIAFPVSASAESDDTQLNIETSLVDSRNTDDVNVKENTEVNNLSEVDVIDSEQPDNLPSDDSDAPSYSEGVPRNLTDNEVQANEQKNEPLEEGKTLDVDDLAKSPIALGDGAGTSKKTVRVKNFDELKKAIADAGNVPTTIIITESFTLTEALTIGEGQDITLTADNKRVEEPWEKIKEPADYKDQGETKQREIIEEGRKRGEDALNKADLDKNPLPSEKNGDIIIKRADGFTDDSLFKVYGKLTLGTDSTAIYIDGNKDGAKTELSSQGSVIDVHGELIMKNAVIMNSYNKHGYTGPIKVGKGGTFIMEGGRISSNTSYEQIEEVTSRPYAAGAVYVSPGGKFTMKNGLIDNNKGGLTGGIFAGSLWGSKGEPAIVNIDGGIIARNSAATRLQMGGGIAGFPASKITINDGIIAGNHSDDVGGGIGISSRYVNDPVNIYNKESAYVPTDYDKFIKENKAEAKINGGLIYKNKCTANGGGVYVDSNDVYLGKTMILDNESGNLGGGIYISFPPITQKLEHILITENKAEGYTDAYVGGSNGGGIWNCPTGFIHIGDGHSVYVYNNEAGSYGQDITFVKKAWNFELNGKHVGGEFYSHISPVTEGKNIIKYIEDGRDRENGETIPGNLSYHTTYSYLKAVYNRALIQEAWKNSLTFVLGNKARNGGGLGSNANLITPDDKGEYKIEFHKKWDNSVDKYHAPTTIRVDLFIVPIDKDADYVKANYGKDNSLFKYGEILIREADKWQTRFDTNYYNGANKDKILEMLGIKDFTNIGLPADTFNMDKGLPFTAEELAKMGYKYLVVEQGTGYYVEVTEQKPTDDKTVEAGVLEITRKYNDDYDDESVRKDKDVYFYLYDPEKQVLTRIGKTTIHEDENTPGVGKTTFTHPILLKKVSAYKYYGKNRRFTEYLKYGWDDMVGYFNEDKGYAIVITQNADGTLTIEYPYLWTDDYYGDGFSARKLERNEDYVVTGNSSHIFTLTNYNWGELGVEKGWKNIEEKNISDSIDIYLLLDGKRVIEGYAEDGNPIYKKITLTAEGEWKGSFKNLDPNALAAGRYSIEEDSDLFAPEIINKEKEKFIIRIGYANEYHEEGQPDNSYYLTNRHFPSENYKNKDGTYNDVKLNLYLDGKKIQEGVFHFTVRENPITGAPYAELEKTFAFKEVELETYGQSIPVKYYDVITNETGLAEYNFYLRKDENGVYTLYLPRLVIKGVPYADLFIAYGNKFNEIYQRYDPTTTVKPLKSDEQSAVQNDYQLLVENHPGPTHEIEILKKWIEGSNQIPDEITVIVTDAEGNKREIQITKRDNWEKTLENLKGTLRKNGYSIKEVKTPNFTAEIKTEKAGLKITGKDKDDNEITLDYNNEELKKVLESGNYRYEIFELEDKTLEFNADNIDSFIKIEKQNDGSYIIRYADILKLTEVFRISLANTYEEPEEPPTPPEQPPVPPSEVPGTGDDLNVVWYALLLALCAALLVNIGRRIKEQ